MQCFGHASAHALHPLQSFVFLVAIEDISDLFVNYDVSVYFSNPLIFSGYLEDFV